MSDLMFSRDEVSLSETTNVKTGAKSVLYYYWGAGRRDEDDQLFFGTIDGSPSEHTIEQINDVLEEVPNERIFFPLPVPWFFANTSVTVANEWLDDAPGWHIKRPWFTHIVDCAGGTPTVVAHWFAIEVKMLERLARHPPHPNIVKYHGCRVRNGRVTGIYLGHLDGDNLWDHVSAGKKPIDKEPFLAALESAIRHLHDVVGIAHNDIQPFNILVSPEGTPTLIDLGSSELIGERISQCRMYSTWGEDPADVEREAAGIAEHPVSTKSRDLAALNKLRTWLDNPVHPWAALRAKLSDADSEA
ncbi:kinase-like domain-containing protein [Cercophora newfieldiana]|uniref:Kinase-like domain-containing protein n=1 Tax=Cercophora newfieldiana TaxID=92897 RepID=A0AA40CMZ7_9PEZI|nr:kinase-like domain-containing protein [Cercophora newfieldiana]